jgi:hypothetical protein
VLRRSPGQWLIAASGAVLAMALVAPPATATVLPPSQNALPGSSFQGADGNQDDADPLIDWQAMQQAGRVYHAEDPNTADSAFVEGSKELEPRGWDFTTESGGVKPEQVNIRDAWVAVDQDDAQTFVYLGFARERAGGSAFLTFELNHDSRLWDNGQAEIPCRRTGDLLITYEPRGNDVDVVIQRWVTTATDARSGCATEGMLDDDMTLTPNVDAQGAINDAAITARLPGSYSGSIPAERFGEAALNLSQVLDGAPGVDPCFSFGSVWMHSRSSPSVSSNMQDYVAPKEIIARSCSASGTKFHDRNANGRRDRGERGLPRWTIWADYDNDGVRDEDEPFAITDRDGQYVINDIRPPRGTYWLREMLPTSAARRRAARAFVRCSLPNADTQGGTGSAPGGMFGCAWGPISTATTTYARGKDFGNYTSALLVLRKELEPSNDPGRFDLLVNSRVLVAAAGDGASRLAAVAPGTYTVSEAATPGTNPANYRSSVECKRGVQRTQRRSGGVYQSLVLPSAARVTCTFRNVRIGSPAIAIDKTGPASAEAGDALRYTLFVTNPGDLPFPASSVRVTDPNCDEPPELTGRGGDTSPRTLDPGDTWTYACSRQTTAPTDCEPTVVPNTATVTGTVGGRTVTDSSPIDTELRCPPPQPIPPQPQPQPPPQPQPQPQPPPNPLVPPGPTPPEAGDAARAALLLRRTAQGCIRSHAPRVNFEGTRIARIQVFVNGQLRRRITVESLQRRLTPRVLLAPGRYRLSVRVVFQRGTGSPPVTLRQVIRICGASRPPFTG